MSGADTLRERIRGREAKRQLAEGISNTQVNMAIDRALEAERRGPN
jgi:hypothetical protein